MAERVQVRYVLRDMTGYMESRNATVHEEILDPSIWVDGVIIDKMWTIIYLMSELGMLDGAIVDLRRNQVNVFREQDLELNFNYHGGYFMYIYAREGFSQIDYDRFCCLCPVIYSAVVKGMTKNMTYGRRDDL